MKTRIDYIGHPVNVQDRETNAIFSEFCTGAGKDILFFYRNVSGCWCGTEDALPGKLCKSQYQILDPKWKNIE